MYTATEKEEKQSPSRWWKVLLLQTTTRMYQSSSLALECQNANEKQKNSRSFLRRLGKPTHQIYIQQNIYTYNNADRARFIDTNIRGRLLGREMLFALLFFTVMITLFSFLFFRNPYFRLSKRKGLCLVGREIGWLFHATAIRKPRHSVLNCSRASLYISPPHTHGELYKYLWKKQHIFACLLCDFLLRCSWGGRRKFRINEPSMAAAAAVLIIKLTLKVTFGAQVADGQS